MTDNEFYKHYFEFITSIQCIENRLRFIYSDIRGIKNSSYLFEDYKSVEHDTIGRLVDLIKKEEIKNGKSYLSDEIYSRINEIREIRNFWVHACCIKGHIGFKKSVDGSILKPTTAKRIIEDEIVAYNLNEDLFNINQNIEVHRRNLWETGL